MPDPVQPAPQAAAQQPAVAKRKESDFPFAVSVADVYEAMTAERPYRSAFTVERALEIMRLEVPRRLDREAFAALEMLLGVQIEALRPEEPRRH